MVKLTFFCVRMQPFLKRRSRKGDLRISDRLRDTMGELGLFQASIGARLQISQVGEDSLLESDVSWSETLAG